MNQRLLYALRLLTVMGCFGFFLSGDYPPSAEAQRGSEIMPTIGEKLAVQDEEIRELNTHVNATDERVKQQWALSNANASAIAVINGNTDQDKWWIGVIGLLVSGSIVFQVRQKKA